MSTVTRRALLRRLVPVKLRGRLTSSQGGRRASHDSEEDALPRYVVRVIRDRCVTFRGPECGACADLCPDGAKAIAMRRTRPHFTVESCSGCGLCVEACPVIPSALEVLPHEPASAGANA